MNGGICSVANGKATCTCKGDWKGATCYSKLYYHYVQYSITGMVIRRHLCYKSIAALLCTPFSLQQSKDMSIGLSQLDLLRTKYIR